MHLSKKLLSLLVVLLVLVITSSCDDEEDDDDDDKTITGSTITPPIDSDQDAEGNLVIINQLSDTLYLYVSDKLKKAIPPTQDTSSFLINIPVTESTGAKTLKIWKASSVSDTENPPESSVYRRWDAVLPTGTGRDEQITWVIKGDKSGEAVGAIRFNYPEVGQDGLDVLYSVNVHIHSKTGARVTSLSAGTEGKTVALDYAYYTMYFKYWYSDPNSTSGPDEIGWRENDDDGNAFTVNLNADTDKKEIDIPAFYTSTKGRVGRVTVGNTTNQYIQIWANGDLIEKKVIGTIPQNYSIIDPGLKRTFNMPEAGYKLEAKTVETSQLLYTFPLCYASPLYEVAWQVTDEFKTVEITNNTDEQLTLHDLDGNYLGYFLDKGTVEIISIPKSVIGLKAINRFNTKKVENKMVIDSWTIDTFTILPEPPSPN